MPLQIKVEGTKELRELLSELSKQYPEIARAALYRQAEIRIMTPSKRDFVPVKDGHLRNSGHVVAEKDQIKVTLGFGGPAGIGNAGQTNSQDVGYAIVQHENLDFAHGVGEAKYLEKPFMEALPNLPMWIAEDMWPDIEKQVK